MTIKTIIELQAIPGQREALLAIMEDILASLVEVPGFLGKSTYEDIKDPNRLIEIVEWDSPEARETWISNAMTSGELKPLLENLAAPFRTINIRLLD